MSRPPRIFVSSTCYDLRQIREDLRHFIEEQLGYEALLSDYRSFPIDPDLTTIENCRRRVMDDADILILIIGARYGSIDNTSAKSITNLEYLCARNKGIPIFVFIEKDVLAIAKIWESNPNADFSKSVDSTTLFEFISIIRTEHKVWTTPFESANDIIVTLISQFSFLMTQGLRTNSLLKSTPLSATMNGLSGAAYRLILERPRLWQYLLLSTILGDEIKNMAPARFRYALAQPLPSGDYVRANQTIEYLKLRVHELLRLMQLMTHLLESSINEICSPQNGEANPEQIILLAQELANLYGQTIEWSNRLKNAYCDASVISIFHEVSELSTWMMTTIQEFPDMFITKIKEIEDSADCYEETVSIPISIKVMDPEIVKMVLDKITQQQVELSILNSK